jgi:hypothetical protein
MLRKFRIMRFFYFCSQPRERGHARFDLGSCKAIVVDFGKVGWTNQSAQIVKRRPGVGFHHSRQGGLSPEQQENPRHLSPRGGTTTGA